MPTLNPTLPDDGDDVTGPSVSIPLSEIIAILNGLIDVDNLANNAVTTAKVLDQAVTAAKIKQETWTAYTPTWTGGVGNPAIGNGTLTGAYIQLGKLVFARITMIAGTTTTFGSGSWFFSLPVTAKSGYGSYSNYGSATILDSGTRVSPGSVHGSLANPTTLVAVSSTAGTAGSTNEVESAIPQTWATNDRLQMTLTYEAA